MKLKLVSVLIFLALTGNAQMRYMNTNSLQNQMSNIANAITPVLPLIPQWNTLNATANSVSVGANGALWCLGTTPTTGGYQIWYYAGNSWVNVDGGAVKIAVGPTGQVWIINADGNIYRRDGNYWTSIPGYAVDIAIGANGAVWALGGNEAPGGWQIFNYNGTDWIQIDGGATKIAVTPNGTPWVITSSGSILRRDGYAWTPIPGVATAISISPEGTVWQVGNNAANNGFGIWYWNGLAWNQMDGGAVNIAAGPGGLLYVTNNQFSVYQIVTNIQVPNTTVTQQTYQQQTTTADPYLEERERHEREERERRARELRAAQKPVIVGCKGVATMADADFSNALATINNIAFDESKLSTAQQVAGNNCLSTIQISGICNTFGFEDTKLSFAKFAYSHCTEPQNYYTLNNLFAFSSSVDALNSYVQSQH